VKITRRQLNEIIHKYAEEENLLSEGIAAGSQAEKVQLAMLAVLGLEKGSQEAADALGCRSKTSCPDRDWGRTSKKTFKRITGKDYAGENVEKSIELINKKEGLGDSSTPGATSGTATGAATTAAAAPGQASEKPQNQSAAPAGAVQGRFVEKYIGRDGNPLKEKEFGWYKVRTPVTVGDADAKWLMDNPKKKRRRDDMVTHVKIYFTGPTELTDKSIESKASYIYFKLGRAGMGGAKDHKGGRSPEAAKLAIKMLALAGVKKKKLPEQ